MPVEMVILAAGQGTRMRSALPKVLHEIAGRPLLQHVLDTAASLAPSAIHVVVGHGADAVQAALPEAPVNWVLQEEQLGTGHAVLQALPAIAPDSTVLVLYGDVPLLPAATLETLVSAAADTPALLTAELDDPTGYGRIVRGDQGELLAVVEQKDATPAQCAIREINTGVLAAPARLLADYLPRVGNRNAQGEYYLPDILPMAVAGGLTVTGVTAASAADVMGINDRIQLAEAEREYQRRVATRLMRDGVGLADPARIDVRGSLDCGADVLIDVNVIFQGEVQLGDRVRVGANCVLHNVRVEADAQIHPFSHLEDATVGAGASVGPYARLRPGTALGDGARVGNFVETKKAVIGPGSKVNHLTYVGDAELGAGVNVGAGTITCNYDGVNKHRTVIGDGAFIGSNSTLVAPLSIGENGFVAAGSTVTTDVPEEQLAVSRGRQRNISGWKRPIDKQNRDS